MRMLAPPSQAIVLTEGAGAPKATAVAVLENGRLGVIPSAPHVVSLAVGDAAVLRAGRLWSPLCPPAHHHSDFLSPPSVPSRSPRSSTFTSEAISFTKPRKEPDPLPLPPGPSRIVAHLTVPCPWFCFRLFLFLPAAWSARRGSS